MKIQKEDVIKLAHMARLNLTEEELLRLADQMTDFLSYCKILEELDTENVKEAAQITGLHSITRKDIVNQEVSPEDLLNCSPLEKQDNQIKIKRIM